MHIKNESSKHKKKSKVSNQLVAPGLVLPLVYLSAYCRFNLQFDAGEISAPLSEMVSLVLIAF